MKFVSTAGFNLIMQSVAQQHSPWSRNINILLHFNDTLMLYRHGNVRFVQEFSLLLIFTTLQFIIDQIEECKVVVKRNVYVSFLAVMLIFSMYFGYKWNLIYS